MANTDIVHVPNVRGNVLQTFTRRRSTAMATSFFWSFSYGNVIVLGDMFGFRHGYMHNRLDLLLVVYNTEQQYI